MRPLRRCPFWQTGGWMSGGRGDILYYMCGMCVQGRVVRPLLLHHVNTSAQALQLVGGMRERRNKQCAKIATSVLQLCSFCFFWQNHRVLWCWCSHFCISLLFTLHPVPVQTYSGYRPNTVFAASATQSNWNLYSAPGMGVKRLGLTKFAMKFCSSLQCWRMSL